MGILAALSVGGPILEKFLRDRAQSKADKKNKQAIARSNLINALSPRANNQPNLQEPKQSGLLGAVGAINTGVGAFNMFEGLKGAATQRELSRQNLLDARELAETRRGERLAIGAFSASQPGPAVKNLDPNLAGRPAVGDAIRRLQEPVPVALPESLGLALDSPASASYAKTTQNLARAAEDRESERLLQSLGIREAEMAIEVARKKLIEVPTVEGRDLTDVRAIGTGLGAGNPKLTQEELFKMPFIMAMNARQTFTDDERASLWSSYSAAGQHLSGEIDKTHQAQANAFEDRLARDLTVKEKAEFTRALDQIVSGLEVGAGFGDVQLLKMLARLQDPNSVVRQAEFETMKEALPFFDQVGIRLRSYVTGEQLNDKGRLHVLNLAVSAYAGRKPLIDSILDDAMEGVVATPGLEGMRNILEFRAERFKLPALEDWTRTVDGKEMSVAQRIGAQRLRLEASWAKTLAENTPIAPVVPVVPVVSGKYGQAYDLDRAAQALKLRRRRVSGPVNASGP